MQGRDILTVYLKEVRDLLRDRRTLISMVVVPTLLMPGLTFIGGVVAYRVIRQAHSVVPSVMIVGGTDSPKLRAAISADQRIKVVATTADWRRRIADKKVRAAVEIPEGFDAALGSGATARVTVYDYQGEIHSGFASTELRRLLSEYRDRVVAARLRARGMPPRVIRPFDVETRNVAPPEKVGGNAIGGLIPYFFLLLSFTGALYPAIDLTAGEKERGTMETILCSPISRTDLVLGKFLMVLSASLATVVCSLCSTGVTLVVAGRLLAARGGGAGLPLTLDPLGLLAVVAMLIPMAVLFSALQLTIALFAKSYKEAQSYISPIIIVIVLPAVVGMLPGVNLTARLALVPVLNVSLVSKELVSGIWHWNYVALIFGSTCAYAAAALAMAVSMFNRESVIFRS